MAIKTSKGRELNATKYKNEKRQEKNRLEKLQALAKKQPNNEQIPLAIKNVRYRRHTPKAEVWSHQEKRAAQLIKYFAGRFEKEYFNVDPKKSAAAITATHVAEKFMRPGKKGVFISRSVIPARGESMFSIGTQFQHKNASKAVAWV